MFQKNLIGSFVIIAGLCILHCQGQDTTTPQQCAELKGQQWNNSEVFQNPWYEIARNPNSSLGCVELQFKSLNSSYMQVNFTFASSPSDLYMNLTYSVNVNYTDVDSNNGTNVTWASAHSPVTYKLLNITDGLLIGCGYENASDTTTAFGFVLSQQRLVQNQTAMLQTIHNVSSTYANLQNISWVQQSELCYTNGATKNLPVLTALFALILFLLKAFH